MTSGIIADWALNDTSWNVNCYSRFSYTYIIMHQNALPFDCINFARVAMDTRLSDRRLRARWLLLGALPVTQRYSIITPDHEEVPDLTEYRTQLRLVCNTQCDNR